MKTRKVLSLILSLLLVMTLLPWEAAPARAADFSGDGTEDNPFKVDNWSDLQACLSRGGYIVLDTSLTWSEGDPRLTVPSGKTANLDLYGWRVDCNYEAAAPVIKVSGTLTLTNGYAGGAIKGGTDSSSGVYVSDGGVFNMYDGEIRDNSGAGVQVSDGGVFNMYGGEIYGNHGGGVQVSDGGVFNMHGGAICENDAHSDTNGVICEGVFNMYGGTIRDNSGAGVQVSDSGVFNMYDGTITGNHATYLGGGVYVEENAALRMAGGEITGNTADSNQGHNVYVHDGGAFVRADGTVEDCEDSVYPDSMPTEGWLLEFDPGEGSGSMYPAVAGDGETFTFPDCTMKGPEGKESFDHWEMTGVNGAFQPGGEITISSDFLSGGVFTVTACWKEPPPPGPHTDHDDCCEHEGWTKLWMNGNDLMYGGAACETDGDYYYLPAGSYYLPEDLAPDKLITFDGVAAELCLNGFSIVLNNEYSDDVIRIINGSRLDLYDVTGNTGTITHASGKHGTGVSVGDACVFNMHGGTICGNDDGNTIGGGVYLYNGGVFNMYGGVIRDNEGSTGGGVYVNGNCTFNLFGGEILDNHAKGWYGGGVYVAKNAALRMAGGKITGNTADSNKGHNVYVRDGGVFVQAAGTVENCENSIWPDSMPTEGWILEFDPGAGTGSMDPAIVGDGEIYTFPDCTMEGPADSESFDYWLMTGYDRIFEPGDQVRISDRCVQNGGITVTAYWTAPAEDTQSSHKAHAGSLDEHYGWTPLYMENGELMCGGAACETDDFHYYLPAGSYYLKENLTVDKAIVFDGAAAELCLNGYSIISSNNEDIIDAIGINSGCRLDLYDVTGNTGTITHGSGIKGTGLDVFGGVFNMYGGTICGNDGGENIAGGVYLFRDSVFNMYGGMIRDNSATDGTGVYLYEGSTFNMYGGVIRDNHATDDWYGGGGVCVDQNAVLRMAGGKITGNTADSNKGHNVYVYSGGAFVQAAGTVEYCENSVYPDSMPTEGRLLEFDPGEGSGSMDPVVLVDGETFTLPECTMKGPEGKESLDHWEMSGVDGLLQPGNEVEISSNCVENGLIKVISHWKEKEPEAYPLWLGGVQVTSANKGDITAAINAATPNAASGKAEYDPAKGILTLTDFVYEGPGHTVLNTRSALYYGQDGKDLTIAFSGKNSLTTQTGECYSSGIDINAKNYTVTFEGDADSTLEIFAGDAMNESSGRSYGIHTYAHLAFTGGTVHAVGGQGRYHSFGIIGRNITMDGGTVIAEGGTAQTNRSAGISFVYCDGAVTVGSGSLTAVGGTGGTEGGSYGIWGDGEETIAVSGGSFLAKGKTQAIFDTSFSYSEDMRAKASTSFEGTEPDTYDSDKINTYKWVSVEEITAYSVAVTPGTGMTKTKSSGAASQDVTIGSAMTDVVYTADEGYYFPADYASVGTTNGVTVKRNSETKITVSGKPTGDVTIQLAPAQLKPASLTLTCTMESPVPADQNREFEYGIYLDPCPEDYEWRLITGNTGVAGPYYTLTMKGGDSVTFVDLPVGSQLTITADPGYLFESNIIGPYTTQAGKTIEADSVLSRLTGSLTVGNTVESTLEADKALAFSFTVTLDNAPISGTFGGMTFKDGTASFTLTDGETVEATGLPAGVGYTVTQEAVDHFTTTKTGDTGTISNKVPASAAFTNAKDSHEITVTADPPKGGTVSGGGTFEYGKEITVTADPNVGYIFLYWTDKDGDRISASAYTFEVEGARELTAHFEETNAHLTVTILEVSKPNNGEAYAVGEKIGYEITVKNDGNVTLTDVTVTDELTGVVYRIGMLKPGESSQPIKASYTVTEADAWTGKIVNVARVSGKCPEQDGLSVSAESNELETDLALPTYEIELSAENGTVTGAGTYDYGKEITVKAEPNEGYSFVNWTEDGKVVSTDAEYTFKVEKDRKLTANFSLNTYTIELSAENGTVSGGGTYDYGKEITVKAEPSEGYAFVNWTEDGKVASTDAEYTFKVEKDRKLTANFSLNTYTIDLTGENGTVTGAGTYDYGKEITVKAEPNEGYAFVNWTEDGKVASTDAEYTFKVEKDRKLTANFIALHTITFYANDGTDAKTEQIVRDGETAALDANPFSRSGSDFAGWNTEAAGGGESYADGQEVTLKADLALYAQWTAHSLSIEIQESEQPYDGAAQTPALTIRDGEKTLTEGTDYTVTYEKDGEPVSQVIGAGSYTVIITGTGEYENAEPVTVSFTIAKAEASITPDDISKLYGEADPELTARVEGALGGDKLDFTLTREAGEDVGEYAITVTLGENPNYEVSTGTGTFTIAAAGITIRALDQTITFGAPFPEWTASSYEVIGLANGEKLDTEPSVRYEWNGVEVAAPYAAGTYAIVPYGASAGNYAIRYESGTLTVEYPPRLTVEDPDPTYPPILETTQGGSVTVDPKAPMAGETVTITPIPDPGYKTDAVTVTDASGNPIRVNRNADGTWKYDQPGKTATIRVSFVREARNPFTDVHEDDYFFEAVLWAFEEGVAAGTTDTTFSPESACTRAQLITFLWRAAGRPEPKTASHPFTDLDPNEYYYKAVLWAYGSGIAAGTTETTFGPNDPVNRAQTVTFLWRLAGKPEPKISASPFTDLDPNEYYYKAVLWAYENGIAAGMTDTTFGPGRTCTRGQIVSFLYRYYKKK